MDTILIESGLVRSGQGGQVRWLGCMGLVYEGLLHVGLVTFGLGKIELLWDSRVQYTYGKGGRGWSGLAELSLR